MPLKNAPIECFQNVYGDKTVATTMWKKYFIAENVYDATVFLSSLYPL